MRDAALLGARLTVRPATAGEPAKPAPGDSSAAPAA